MIHRTSAVALLFPAFLMLLPAMGPGIALSGTNSHHSQDFSGADALTLTPSLGGLATAVIDERAGFSYFGHAGGGGVTRVRLSNFTQAGTITIGQGIVSCIFSSAIDQAAGFAYFGVSACALTYPPGVPSPGMIVKVRLSDFIPVASLTLNQGESSVESAVIDPNSGFVYFATDAGDFGPSHNAINSTIVKIRLSDFSRVGSLTVNEVPLQTAVIDPRSGFAYFATGVFAPCSGVVLKIRLADLTQAGALTLGPKECWFLSAIIDTSHGYAYFGNYGNPGIIVKINLSTFTRVDAITLNTNETNVGTAVIGPDNSFAYFGVDRISGADTIIKIRLSDFSRVATVGLNPGETTLRSSVVDQQSGSAYFGTSTNLGIVVRVQIAKPGPCHNGCENNSQLDSGEV